jgi:hypothetical protein
MVNKVKKNYVGYSDKVMSKNAEQFQRFTDSLQQIADQSNTYQCLSLCREWLSFFKDKHMDFAMDLEGLSPDTVRSIFSKEEKTRWDKNSFASYLHNNKKVLDSIEGIWSYGIYEVGIIKDNTIKQTEFIGFVLKADSSRWMPQQIKFRIRKTKNNYETVFFRGGDHSINHPVLSKRQDTLDFDIFGKWFRGYHKKQEIASESIDLSPKFKVIDNETCLLEMPSFETLSYVAIVDSIVKANENILKNTKHLIIDLRDNSGGSVFVYKSIMPYIYTNPILTVGGMVLATEDNIKDGYSTEYPEATDSIQKVLKQNLADLKAHQGELYNLYPIDTIKFEKPLENPERISFLVNKNTGSAAELFLLQAKQSKKVTIFGTNSAGAVDYAEFVTSKMPCPYFMLWYPASKSLYSIKHPLDNIGIEPDVKIPNNIKDWVKFVKNYNQ